MCRHVNGNWLHAFLADTEYMLGVSAYSLPQVLDPQIGDHVNKPQVFYMSKAG